MDEIKQLEGFEKEETAQEFQGGMAAEGYLQKKSLLFNIVLFLQQATVSRIRTENTEQTEQSLFLDHLSNYSTDWPLTQTSVTLKGCWITIHLNKQNSTADSYKKLLHV